MYSGAGVHVFADGLISVYVVARFQATSDGFTAVPVSSLGEEYIVAAYAEDPMFRAVWNMKLPSTVTVTAPFDDTRCIFTLGGNPMTVTAGGMNPVESIEFTLHSGDTWMATTSADNADISGSLLRSSKPVAVVTGNQCTNIPVGNQWCDYTVEMNIPTHTWGTHYHVAKIPGRKYPPLIRIFANSPQTTIYRDGQQIGFINDAGGIQGEAFHEMRAGQMVDYDFDSHVFSGDKPVGIMLYNCGVQEDGYPLPDSDPFTSVITPIEQYQKDITFCTPATFGGDKFAQNFLNLVYQSDISGTVPEDMEFGEASGSSVTWSLLRDRFPGDGDVYEHDVEGKKYALKLLTLPTVGVFKIRAEKPFAAYSFGYDWCDSYGYPTSGGYRDLMNKKDDEPPVPGWSMDEDGNVSGHVYDSTDNSKPTMAVSNLSMVLM